MTQEELNLRIKNYLTMLEIHPQHRDVLEIIAIIGRDKSSSDSEKDQIIEGMIARLEEGGSRSYRLPLREKA
jgi:hypothetical protein